MISLTLAILSSASLALLFRHTEHAGHNRYAVTLSNYVTATLVSMGLLLLSRSGADGAAGGAAGLLVSPDPAAIAVGIPGGLFFFSGFILYQHAVRRHGPGLAGMYGKLGVLVPMVLSMVVWREFPLPRQAVGIALALVAIVVSQTGGGAGGTATAVDRPPRFPASRVPTLRPLLLLQLVVMGFAEFSNKVFEYYGDLGDRPSFLTILFGTAALAAAVVLAVRRDRLRGAALLWGVAVGVPNLASSYFLLDALEVLPAALVFPLFSAGSTMTIAVGALVLYRDHLRPRQWFALALTAGALSLVR